MASPSTLPLHSWTVTRIHPTQGRTFQRPLDPTELCFFWSGRFNGTADILHHTQLRLLNSRDAQLFSDTNIVKAWLSTKRRYPLVGATVQVTPEGGDNVPAVHFVVREHDLAVLRPHEIVFGHTTCADELPERIAAIWDGLRPLSDDLLVQLHVFRETNPQRRDVLHLIVLIAHCVADGTAVRTLMRSFLDTLARGEEQDTEPAQIPLEERLAMLIPLADLEPVHMRSLSPAIRRWRQAVGAVIFQLRIAKSQGGHTLPCRHTRVTPFILARPGFASTLLTEAQTATVLANCRLHGVTFGSAYLALTQVAMTRVLYRRYLRGEISEEEWEYRKRQPYRVCSPVNVRPYLDKSWYGTGGGGEFMLCISFIRYRLPFMTLGGTKPQQYREQELSDGAPPFSDLLTFDRFLHRAGLVKNQTKASLRHPLFAEAMRATCVAFARNTLQLTQHRDVKTTNGTNIHADDVVLGVTDMPSVIAHMGSTLGNVDVIFPTEYPLPSTDPLSPFSSIPSPARAGYVVPPSATEVNATPRIAVENGLNTQCYPRPGELFLSTLSSGGLLNMFVSYDGNVYEAGVVREWLEEVRAAVLWYLGQTHRDHDHCVAGAGGEHDCDSLALLMHNHPTAETVIPATPEVWSFVGNLSTANIAFSLAVASFLLVVISFSRGKSNPRGDALLLTGPPDSGKTALFSNLAYNQTLPSHTSLQTNSAYFTLSPTKRLRVIDVPGHPRIRDQFREHLKEAKAVAFVVDCSTISRNGSVVAEHLHHVLHAITSLPPTQSKPMLYILAHKTDLLKVGASSNSMSEVATNRVRVILERELEKRRASQLGGVGVESLGGEEEETEMGGLEGSGGGAFKFAEWEGGNVEFISTWVKIGEVKGRDGLDELRELLSK